MKLVKFKKKLNQDTEHDITNIFRYNFVVFAVYCYAGDGGRGGGGGGDQNVNSGRGCIFIYSHSARLISFEVRSSSVFFIRSSSNQA